MFQEFIFWSCSFYMELFLKMLRWKVPFLEEMYVGVPVDDKT